MSENVSVLNKNNYYILINNRDQCFLEGSGADKNHYVFMKMNSNMVLTTINDALFINSIQLSITKDDIFDVKDYLKNVIMSL